jgi:hypothetical protein
MLMINILYFIIFFFSQQIIGKEIQINNTKIFNSETLEFSSTSDLIISGDKIKEIKPNKSKTIDYYILPTFCDLDVTLGMDSLGSGNTRKGVDLALQSYLYHGFSHIYSVNNPPWLLYLKNKNNQFPIVKYGNRSILFKSKEFSNLPESMYKVISDSNELIQESSSEETSDKNIVTILNRYNPNNESYFEMDHFREISKKSNDNTIYLVSNFGDPTGIMDSIRAGIKYLKDPIPTNILRYIPIEVFENIHYIPELNVYQNLYLQTDNNLMDTENNYRASISKFYYKYYYKITREKIGIKTITTKEIDDINKEYPDYIKFIKENKKYLQNIIVSGGSGNYLSFPGISAIRELLLLNESIEDPYKAINFITKNSCKLFSNDYDGTIQVNGKANLLLYKFNPLEKLNKIIEIHSIYINGNKVIREEMKGSK